MPRPSRSYADQAGKFRAELGCIPTGQNQVAAARLDEALGSNSAAARGSARGGFGPLRS